MEIEGAGFEAGLEIVRVESGSASNGSESGFSAVFRLGDGSGSNAVCPWKDGSKSAINVNQTCTKHVPNACQVCTKHELSVCQTRTMCQACAKREPSVHQTCPSCHQTCPKSAPSAHQECPKPHMHTNDGQSVYAMCTDSTSITH